jgi:hypothetical protein
MAKVLIVIDADFRFSAMDGTADFTFTALLGALTGAGHQVTRAHRNTDASADIPMFNFATSDNLLNYDVIWLIGRAGRNAVNSTGTSGTDNISDAEIAAIARFMAAGGGVFATGDHDSIGADMCGHIPRVRAMRSWYGINDSASPMPASFPRNFPVITGGRADTTQRNPLGDYGGDMSFVWFENQSDWVPQPITPTSSPAHPILRRGGSDIVVYPDHMHEGNALGDVMGYDYTQSLPFNGESFPEFPQVAGNREMPEVIATGQTTPYASKYVATGAFVGSDSAASGPKTVNTLSVYDGRAVGVGRIVTGSTFHHYIDINLSGDSSVTPAQGSKVGPNAQKGNGLSDAPGTAFADITAVYDNITRWLARPRPAIQLILERSTFSQDEATANPDFDGAILITVDGLKPNQFPGGGIATLMPTTTQLNGWAPTITPSPATGLEITPIAVNSDDPMLPDRLQRFTFTYRVHFTDVAAAFGFMAQASNVQVAATLTSAAVTSPLTDFASIELVKSANPFMLDLDHGNQTVWLSSDVKVFHVVAGVPGSGLVDEASRQQAIDYLKNRLSAMTDAEFDNTLTGDEEGSVLSSFARTTGTNRKVYNFAIARVRLDPASAPAHGVHVFFRIVPSPSTASLTYHESMGVPLGSYLETGGANTIALPGQNGAGTEWWSFPCFLHTRSMSPGSQIDDNVTDFTPGHTFVGALLDNNLDDPYLPPTPMGGTPVSLPTLLMGEHQCLVVQIRYAGTPIPDGANPFTSDKLSQRNLALSPIANPGLDASRMALHTFEIEATPHAIGGGSLPDELLLQWHREPPEGTEVRLEISTWDARGVVELADQFYPRHEIRALDAHTIAAPGGGVRYIPIPPGYIRQTGVITVHFPLGVKKGQRFDVSVHQVTTRSRQPEVEFPKATKISREEAARLLKAQGSADALPRGVFDLGENKVLITDLRVLDDAGDHAIIVEHPDPADVAKARQVAGRWRATIGAFQLGIPVSIKEDMLAHHLRLLSVLRWRAEWLRPNSRWYETFIRYVELNAEKVRALGGDPYSVPPTPDGNIPLPGKGEDRAGCSGCLLGWLRPLARRYKRA